MALSKKIVSKIETKAAHNKAMKACLIDVLSAVDDSRQGKRVINSHLNKLVKGTTK